MSPEECRDVFEMLSEYIDGELPMDTCEQIEKHIADCPPCVQFVASLRKNVSVNRDFRPAENPPLEFSQPTNSPARTGRAPGKLSTIGRTNGQIPNPSTQITAGATSSHGVNHLCAFIPPPSSRDRSRDSGHLILFLLA